MWLPLIYLVRFDHVEEVHRVNLAHRIHWFLQRPKHFACLFPLFNLVCCLQCFGDPVLVHHLHLQLTTCLILYIPSMQTLPSIQLYFFPRRTWTFLVLASFEVLAGPLCVHCIFVRERHLFTVVEPLRGTCIPILINFDDHWSCWQGCSTSRESRTPSESLEVAGKDLSISLSVLSARSGFLLLVSANNS